MDALIRALRRGDRWERAAAAFELGQRFYGGERDERALQPLVAALGADDRSVRQSAAYALGRLQHPNAVGPLLLLLDDPGSFVKDAVVSALLELNVSDARMTPPLLRDLDIGNGAYATNGQRLAADLAEQALRERFAEDTRVRERLWRLDEQRSDASRRASALSAAERLASASLLYGRQGEKELIESLTKEPSTDAVLEIGLELYARGGIERLESARQLLARQLGKQDRSPEEVAEYVSYIARTWDRIDALRELAAAAPELAPKPTAGSADALALKDQTSPADGKVSFRFRCPVCQVHEFHPELNDMASEMTTSKCPSCASEYYLEYRNDSRKLRVRIVYPSRPVPAMFATFAIDERGHTEFLPG